MLQRSSIVIQQIHCFLILCKWKWEKYQTNDFHKHSFPLLTRNTSLRGSFTHFSTTRLLYIRFVKFLFNLMDESCTAHYSVPYITFYHLVICAPVPIKTASQWEDRRSLICVFIQSLTIFKRFEVSEVVGASILMQINRKHWRNYTWIHRSIWYFNDFLGLRINFMKKSMALGGNKK